VNPKLENVFRILRKEVVLLKKIFGNSGEGVNIE
jgi:hypothetical protein